MKLWKLGTFALSWPRYKALERDMIRLLASAFEHMSTMLLVASRAAAHPVA
jgi:hypothetical protein